MASQLSSCWQSFSVLRFWEHSARPSGLSCPRPQGHHRQGGGRGHRHHPRLGLALRDLTEVEGLELPTAVAVPTGLSSPVDPRRPPSTPVDPRRPLSTPVDPRRPPSTPVELVARKVSASWQVEELDVWEGREVAAGRLGPPGGG